MAVPFKPRLYRPLERAIIAACLLGLVASLVIALIALPVEPPPQTALPATAQPIDTSALIDVLNSIGDIRTHDTRRVRYDAALRSHAMPPPLMITRLRIERTPHAVQSAALSVENTTDYEQRGEATLLVSSNMEQAFDTVILRAESIPFQIAPRESTLIALPPVHQLAPGIYTLTALVESVDADGDRAMRDYTIDSLPTVIDPIYTLRAVDDANDVMTMTFTERTIQPGQTLRFSQVVVESASRTPLQVQASVQNVSDQPQAGWAWVFAAPPDSAEPWNNPYYTAPERPIWLEAGAQTIVEYDLSALSLPDDFALSLWVHGENVGGRFHSDGQGIPTRFNSRPALAAEIDALEVVRDAEQVRFALNLELHNDHQQAVDAVVLLTLSPIDANDPVRNARFASQIMRTTLDTGETFAFSDSLRLSLADGVYRLVIWTFRADDSRLRWAASHEYPARIIIDADSARAE
jgi:hypothetical protein